MGFGGYSEQGWGKEEPVETPVTEPVVEKPVVKEQA